MPELDLSDAEPAEPVPLSALNHLLYCERRCALIYIDGVFVENVYTLEGELAHANADTPGYETAAGVRAIRALPLFSKRLRLVGKADIVEFRGADAYPVDYKRGPRRRWLNDDVQLCAQALCLEEMLGRAVPRGAVFHGRSKRRREVEFSVILREETERAVARLHSLIASRAVPAAALKPQCDGCSLRELCLPELRNQMPSAAERIFAGDD